MVVGVDLNTVVADEAAPRGPRREPWLQLGNPGVVAVDLSTYLYATLRAADLSGTDLTGDQMLYVASTTLRAVQDDLGMFPSDSPPTTVLVRRRWRWGARNSCVPGDQARRKLISTRQLSPPQLVGELVDDAAKLEGRPAAHRLQFAHKPIYDAAQDGNWQEFDKLRGEYARERAPLLFVIKAMAAHAFGWALALAPRQADGTLLLGDTVISIDGDLVVLAAGQGRTVLRPAGGGGDTVRLFRDQQLAAAGWSPARLRMLALLGGSDTQPYGVYGLGGVRIERLARMLPADVEAGGMAAVLGWLMQQGFLGDEEQQLLRQAALRAVAPMLAQPVLHVASAKPDAGAGRTWLDGRTFWVGPLFDLADVGCQDYEPSAAEQHDMQLLAALSANDVGRIARSAWRVAAAGGLGAALMQCDR